MENCLFCKIVKGDIPSTKVYEDELVLAFRDIAPQAPTHVLVIPKAHLSGVSAVTEEYAALAGHCIAVCAKVAQLEGLKDGFRVVSNCGAHAGQTVEHLHFHVLGGKQLSLEMA